jgi:NADH-quinone oxidoreductase subunit L
VALGAGAYSAGIFHLMTHAFFKAVLFLGAGSVIIALHHEQDMRKMGGLRKYMPITYWTVLIGALANAGIPPVLGLLLQGDHRRGGAPVADARAHLRLRARHGGDLRERALLLPPRVLRLPRQGALRVHAHEPPATAEEPHHEQMHGKPHESPWVVTVPLILLAIPSVFIGAMTIGPMLYGDWFGSSIAKTATMAELGKEWHGWWQMVLHAFTGLPVYLGIAGVATAWILYILRPDLPAKIKAALQPLPSILERKYGFDDFNDWFFAGGARRVGTGLWAWGDKTIIDGSW